MKAALKRIWEVANLTVVIAAGIIVIILVSSSLMLQFPVLFPYAIALTRQKLPSDRLTIEQMLCLEEEAVKIATSNPKIWDGVRTVEEIYKDTYSGANPPPVWKDIEKEYELGKKLGVVQAKQLPAYGDLTRKERLLLEQSDYGYSIIQTISRKLRDGLNPETKYVEGRSSDWDIRFCIDRLPDSYTSGEKPLSQDEAERWFLKTLVGGTLLVSPISNSIMKLNCADFTPGDGFVKFYYLDDTWNRLMESYPVDADGISPSAALDSALVYYRIYGEKGVIAEGIHPILHAGIRYRYFKRHPRQGL